MGIISAGKHGANSVVIHLDISNERINGWLLNLVLFAFFLVELALVYYIVTLAVYEESIIR